MIPAVQWSSALLPFLAEGHSLKLPLEGASMVPLLVGGRDEVLVEEVSGKILRRGDIVLYIRQDGTHVLHRIHHIYNNKYFMLGDAQTWIEGPVNKEDILAAAVAVIRKGETITCSSRGYRFISGLWLVMRPVRPLILKIIYQKPFLIKILKIILRSIHLK